MIGDFYFFVRGTYVSLDGKRASCEYRFDLDEGVEIKDFYMEELRVFGTRQEAETYNKKAHVEEVAAALNKYKADLSPLSIDREDVTEAAANLIKAVASRKGLRGHWYIDCADEETGEATLMHTSGHVVDVKIPGLVLDYEHEFGESYSTREERGDRGPIRWDCR